MQNDWGRAILIGVGRSQSICTEIHKAYEIWDGLKKIKFLDAAEHGGRDRNRTDVQGFAVLCIATLPPGHIHGAILWLQTVEVNGYFYSLAEF